MADQPGVWGIDVGQCALKAIRLAVIDGQVTATAFDYVEHPKILSQPDADPDQLTREALEKFLSRNQLRGDVVAISIPGQSGLARFVKLPPVEEKKITDIVRFEAKQQIPFPLDEVVWDYQKIGTGLVTDGFAMETEIGLFAIKRDMVNRSLQHFKDVNVEVNVVQMAPLALCNFVSYDLLNKGGPAEAPKEGENGQPAEEAAPAAKDDGDKRKRCVVALDIGADNSNLVITDAERIIWQRPIPVGGNRFTRDLTKELKLTFAKAEHLKRNATKSPDLKKILAALKPGLNEFVGEVQRSLGYFTNTHRDAHVEYMIGLGNAFRLPGLKDYLGNKLQIDVRKLQKLERLAGDNVITAPAFTQNVLSFAVAYGLALQGLEMTKLKTNLLPQDIQFERMVRAKKPWAVAAAASLLVGVSSMTIGYSMEYRAVAAKSVKDAMVDGEKQVKEASDWAGKYSRREGEVNEKVKAVRNMIAGQEERLNWVLLNRFINECLPIPAMRVDGTVKAVARNDVVITDVDGKEVAMSKLPVPVKLAVGNKIVDPSAVKPGDRVAFLYQEDRGPRTYWAKPGAQEAYLKFYDRQNGANPNDQPDEEGAEELIQVNVEGIYALYSNDLKTYHSAIMADLDGMARMGMIDKDRKTPPDGKGWVIEIRGYTYHNDADNFLIKTIVDNLATRPIKSESAKPDKPAGDKPAAKSPDSQSDDKGVKPEVKAPKPDDKAAKSDDKPPKAVGPAAKSDDKAPKPDNKAGKPDDKAPRPSDKAGKPDDKSGKPDDKGAKPSDKPSKTDPKADKTNKDSKKDENLPKKDEAAEKEELWNKIVAEKVTHVFLYKFRPDRSPEATRYYLIGGSQLQALIGGGTRGGAGAPGTSGPASAPKGMGGGAGSGSWSPLLTPGSSASAGTGPAGGAGPGGAGSSGTSGKFGPGGAGAPAGMDFLGKVPSMNNGPPPGATAPPGVPPAPKTPADKTEAKSSSTTRTEFIVLFIWKEPTPSDDVLGLTAPAAAAQPGARR